MSKNCLQMKLLLNCILFLFLSPANLFSQQPALDKDSVKTFIIEPGYGHYYCTPDSTIKTCPVIKSDSLDPVNFIFIPVKYLQNTYFEYSKRYICTGKVTLREEETYGCFSAVWKETKVYLSPIPGQEFIRELNNSK